MSSSISSRDRESQFRGDRSVGSCRSSRSTRSSSQGYSRSLKRLIIDDSNENSAFYLPSNLIQQKHHRYLPNDIDDRSLRELDETVASVAKMHSSTSSLDKGERSPTSVSHDLTNSSRDSTREKVVHHGTSRSLPLDLLRAESASGRSTLSKGSRSSRSSRESKGSSKASRRRRYAKLERRISETIMSSASAASDSTYSTKECNDSACRSAQFILTDLFHEASKSNNEDALPQPPFGGGTSWSQMLDRADSPTMKLEPPGIALPSSLPPRHQDGHGVIQPEEELTPEITCRHQEEGESKASIWCTSATSQAIVDSIAEFEQHRVPSSLVDVIKEVENESEASSFYVFDMQEQSTNISMRKKANTTSATSECTGTLDFSVDDSLLQYSSTNETSNFSQLSKVSPLSPTGSAAQSSDEKLNVGEDAVEQSLTETIPGPWTNFDESPFKGDGFTDDFGFDCFLPFEKDVAEKIESPSCDITPPQTEIDPAWDTSRDFQSYSKSSFPKSPASVFNFFTIDDDDDNYEIGENPQSSEYNWEHAFHPATVPANSDAEISL